MTLEQIAAELPNGLHDSRLRSLAIDYAVRCATFLLDISVGDPDAATDEQREAYKLAEVTISDLLWCIIEPPKTGTRPIESDLRIDAGSIGSLPRKPQTPDVPADAFAWWIFVDEWNAFIYVAAKSASLKWLPVG